MVNKSPRKTQSATTAKQQEAPVTKSSQPLPTTVSAYERLKEHPELEKYFIQFPDYNKINAILLFMILEELKKR